jgi:glutamate--cysteine ligase
VSTLLPDQSSGEYQQPVQHAELTNYFHQGSKPKADWRIGAEFEKFALHRNTGKLVKYDEPGGISQILESLVQRYGWEPHFQQGVLTTLTRLGSAISLEPGCQLEFSSPPVEDLHRLADHLLFHRDEIRSVVDPEQIVWVGAGVTPISKVEEFPKPLRQRHQLMAESMPKRGPMSLYMMYATASTQATFDYSDEADAMKKLATALTLSPIINAIWGNSPIYGGEKTGWTSFRGRIWLGMDPDRCGLLPKLVASELSFATWTEYLLDLPLLFLHHDGELLPPDGRTFRDFLNHGIAGRFPTLADWELHLTTVFPEVRLKQFLEVRGADANPPALALAVPAFWKGLLYDPQALEAACHVAKKFEPHELPGLFESVATAGLSAHYQGRSVLDWAKELLTVSQVGLKLQNHPEECRFLEPVEAILDAGQSPGMQLHAKPTLSLPDLWQAWEY